MNNDNQQPDLGSQQNSENDNAINSSSDTAQHVNGNENVVNLTPPSPSNNSSEPTNYALYLLAELHKVINAQQEVVLQKRQEIASLEAETERLKNLKRDLESDVQRLERISLDARKHKNIPSYGIRVGGREEGEKKTTLVGVTSINCDDANSENIFTAPLDNFSNSVSPQQNNNNSNSVSSQNTYIGSASSPSLNSSIPQKPLYSKSHVASSYLANLPSSINSPKNNSNNNVVVGLHASHPHTILNTNSNNSSLKHVLLSPQPALSSSSSFKRTNKSHNNIPLPLQPETTTTTSQTSISSPNTISSQINLCSSNSSCGTSSTLNSPAATIVPVGSSVENLVKNFQDNLQLPKSKNTQNSVEAVKSNSNSSTFRKVDDFELPPENNILESSEQVIAKSFENFDDFKKQQSFENQSTYDNTSTSFSRANSQLIPPGTPCESPACLQDFKEGSFHNLYNSTQIQRIYKALFEIEQSEMSNRVNFSYKPDCARTKFAFFAKPTSKNPPNKTNHIIDYNAFYETYGKDRSERAARLIQLAFRQHRLRKTFFSIRNSHTRRLTVDSESKTIEVNNGSNSYRNYHNCDFFHFMLYDILFPISFYKTRTQSHVDLLWW